VRHLLICLFSFKLALLGYGRDCQSELDLLFLASPDGPALYRATLDGKAVELLIRESCGDIEVDTRNGKIYFISISYGIKRANLDGTEVEYLVPHKRNIAYISVDIENNRIYWTAEDEGVIRRATLDGDNVEDIIHINDPLGIALDLSNGKIYFSSHGEIYRADLDGSNLARIRERKNWNWIYDLAVGGSQLYWGDSEGNIYRADLDGKECVPIITGIGRPVSVKLDTYQDMIYWSEFRGPLRRARLDGSHMEDLLVGYHAYYIALLRPMGPIADPGGPYVSKCQGFVTNIQLVGLGSYDQEGSGLVYLWRTDYPGAFFSDPNSPVPLLTVDTSSGRGIDFVLELTVIDNSGRCDAASTSVKIAGCSASDLVYELIRMVDLAHLGKGVKNSLAAKLYGALKALEDRSEANEGSAEGRVAAFVKEVQALQDNKVPSDVAGQLINAARKIIHMLNSGSP